MRLAKLRYAAVVGAAVLVMDFSTAGNSVLDAQERLVYPGDSSVTGRNIESYTNEWQVFRVASDGGKTPSGRWLDSLDVVEIDDQEHLRRIQRSFGPDGALRNRQLQMVKREDMSPLRSHFVAGAASGHTDYGTDEIAGFMSTGPESKALVFSEPPQSAFDFQLAGILLVGMNLQPGETVRFPSYDLRPTGMTSAGPTGVSLAVQEVEAVAHEIDRISAGYLGEVDALRVVVVQGRQTLTFWLTENAPHIVRLTVATPAGTTVWEM